MTTTRFADLTHHIAATLGRPDARIVLVEHPLGGADEASIIRRADAAIERLVRLFTT